jgi:hypothetical protein
MMFLVLFGSLAAAMAVVAQSNLRTADSGMKLSRAMSAAETGMIFAKRRLTQESARFVITKGVVDADFAEKLWMGTYSSGSAADGTITITQPVGYNTGPGVIHAVRDAHAADGHNIVVSGAPGQPIIDTSIERLRVPGVAVFAGPNSPYFILTYQMIDNQAAVRVTSEGVDGDIHRVLEMDFKVEKKIEFAILSPNRIMIGKNVLVDGPLGSRYGIVAGELDSANGDPLVMRSDFHYLAPALDTKLDTLYSQIIGHDVDGDGRLRPDHPVESLGLSGHPELADYDGDEYVDEFDLFMSQFDSNTDHRVVYDTAKATAAGLGGNLNVEFNVDPQMARLIDSANPDRDGDGQVTISDTGLGYNDGVLDKNDEYAKVRGRVAFKVARAPWESANGGSYQNIVQGAVRADIEVPPVKFEVTDDEMREITTAMFDASATWFQSHATGVFATQAASGGTYTAPNVNTWEAVPYGANGAYDYYMRPVYDGYTFTNVKIPKNNNSLFKNCTFVGVTYIDTQVNCVDHDWNYAGALEKKEQPPGSGNYVYVLKFPSLVSHIGATVVPDTRVESNNIRFENCTFLGSLSGSKPSEYTHWRNKVQMTGNTRFYIDPADPDLAVQADAATLIAKLNTISAADRAEMSKSSILMPGWSVDVGNFNNQQNADPTLTPKVKLKGTIIAGVLDVRGTADVLGTLLMTFRPVAGQGPLYYGGLTDAFNTTIGYFGPSDGDGEGQDQASQTFTGFGEINLRYDPNAKLPDGIPWPIQINADPETYVE